MEKFDGNSIDEARLRLPRWVVILISISIAMFLLSISFYILVSALWLGIPGQSLPNSGEMATLLFASASLALIIFSILVAAVAIFGWQALKNDVREDIEASTKERINAVENELKGRIFNVMGFMVGTLHSNPDKLDQANKENLAEAVYFCRQGYKMLQNVPGTVRYTALNNLVYYSALYGEADKESFLLENAEQIKKIGQERDHPDFLLTYCRVILQYSTDAKAIEEARNIAQALVRGERLPIVRQRREATFYVASLSAKLIRVQGAL